MLRRGNSKCRGELPRPSNRHQSCSLTCTACACSMVNNPVTLTLADLLNPALFNPVTLPVTLVCAGNRRKEQNVVRKSLGFSWGPAGLSTSLFTGVYLADVLEHVQPRNEGTVGQPGFKRAAHVIFEGAEDLPNGKYGTSQLLRWARNKGKGMLLAWAMNGEVSGALGLHRFGIEADDGALFLTCAGSRTRPRLPTSSRGAGADWRAQRQVAQEDHRLGPRIPAPSPLLRQQGASDYAHARASS